MICRVCNKKIESGEYRYRETAKAFITHHRVCCADDPCWAKIDAEKALLDARNQRRLFAMKAFQEEWDVPELDDEIERLEELCSSKE